MEKNFKVVYTTNLNQFRFVDTNRNYANKQSQNRIAEIAKSMKTNGVLPIPIIVTSKFYIVDGQHRVEAAKKAGLGVYYLVNDSIPNTPRAIFIAAQIINKHAKVWGKKDYIHGFAELGYESYEMLEQFSQKFPMFSITEQIMFLRNSGTDSVDKSKFAEGKFEVKNLKKAEELASKVLELKEVFKGYNKSVFVRTLLTIIEKKKGFKLDEFIYKVKLRPTSLVLCGDKRSYSALIEDIYNYKRRESEKLNLRIV